MNNSIDKLNLRTEQKACLIKDAGSCPDKSYLYDILIDGIVEYDSNFKILNCNASYEKMTGYSLPELKETSLMQIISPKFHDQEKKLTQSQPQESGYCEQLQCEYIRKNNTVVPVEKNIYLMNDKNCYLAVVKDISHYILDKKELMEQAKILKKTNTELDSFVSIITHDLKTPITTISAFMNIFEEDYLNQIDEKGKDIISRMKSSIKQMSTTINDLRALSKLSKVENPFEDVNICALIKSIVDRIGFVYKDKLLIFNIESNMPVVLCDKIKIEQVFSNLIDNAIKYSSKKTCKNILIEIGHEDKNDFHVFYVKDNGIGIEEIYLDRIFHLFERLHTAAEYEGTGAGLYIVDTIIKQHEGKVWLDSIPGEGTTFYFSIRKNLKP